MINLRLRTEYSFRYAYGKMQDVVRHATITDRGNTFSHVPFYTECKKLGIKPRLGVELAFVEDASLRVRQTTYYVTLLAKNNKGLSFIYRLVSKSTQQKFRINRLDIAELSSMDENVIVIIENACLEKHLKKGLNAYYGVSPLSSYGDFKKSKLPFVALSDNLYSKPEEKDLYEIILGKGVGFSACRDREELSHILNEDEWRFETFLDEKQQDEAIARTYEIDGLIEDFELTEAKLPATDKNISLRDYCLQGAAKRNIDILNMPEYLARLEREIELINEKEFGDYFFLVADLVSYAKKHMLVGPARGSSAGSLVCYLLEITEVDPLKYGLIFERFIDINRGGYKLNNKLINQITSL